MIMDAREKYEIYKVFSNNNITMIIYLHMTAVDYMTKCVIKKYLIKYTRGWIGPAKLMIYVYIMCVTLT